MSQQARNRLGNRHFTDHIRGAPLLDLLLFEIQSGKTTAQLSAHPSTFLRAWAIMWAAMLERITDCNEVHQDVDYDFFSAFRCEENKALPAC